MERKLVVVHDMGPLPELGGIAGPVSAPTRIPISKIGKLLNNGRTVYECNPVDPRAEGSRVKLTVENYRDEHFLRKTDAASVSVPPASNDTNDRCDVSDEKTSTIEPPEKKEEVSGTSTTGKTDSIDMGNFEHELEIPEIEN